MYILGGATCESAAKEGVKDMEGYGTLDVRQFEERVPPTRLKEQPSIE